MKRLMLALCVGAAAYACGPLSALADPGNTTTSSTGVVQVGGASSNDASGSTGAVQADVPATAPTATVDTGAGSTTLSAPVASSGGSNNATGSTGAVQVAPVAAAPAATASAAGRSASVGTNTGAASPSSPNTSTGSTGTVQVGGGNAASRSTGAVQSSGAAGRTDALAQPLAATTVAPTAAHPVARPAAVPAPARTQRTIVPRSTVARPAAARASLNGVAGRLVERTNGTLPFTGLRLGGELAAAVALLALGFGLRRRSWSRV